MAKFIDCSVCSKVKKGTLHTYEKTDNVGKWYRCDRCKKTMTWELVSVKK